MKTSQYPRGSEWRKWDLHLHSPATVLNNQFDGATDEEKWEKYFDKLSSVGEYAALGITDYFSVNGYKKVKSYKDDGYLENILTVLANVELRILPVTEVARSINLHVIFSPEIIDELDDRFFSSLEFIFDSEPYKCTRSDLVRLGRKYNNDSTLPEHVAYAAGVEQFKTTAKDIHWILSRDKRLRENAIVSVSNSNKDGNSGIQHSSLAAIRQEIYRFSQSIFSGNIHDRDYFLGKKADSVQEIIRKYGNLKPCIHGSDAHNLEKVCNPDLRRFTWIKCDPTFDGLKQILHEPENRVFIGELPPKVETVNDKRGYFIDKIWIETSQNNKEWFDETREIHLNTDLVAIIGNKGNGKSALADIIASAGNSDNRVFSFLNSEKFLDVSSHTKYKGVIEFLDGYRSEKEFAASDFDSTQPSKVVYLSQPFVKNLCESEDVSQLQNEIFRVIHSHIPEEEVQDTTSLPELISKQTSYIEKLIEEEKVKLYELNKRIEQYEDYQKPEFREKNLNSLREKERQLQTVKEKEKPPEVQSPDRSQNDRASRQLKTLKKAQNKLLAISGVLQKDLNELVIERQVLENIKNDVETFKRQFIEIRARIDSDAILKKHKITSDSILMVKDDDIFTQPITSALESVSTKTVLLRGKKKNLFLY